MARSCVICEYMFVKPTTPDLQSIHPTGGETCLECTALVEHEAQIEHTKETLEKLLLDLPVLKHKVNLKHDRLIGRLPEELTSIIFTSYVHDGSDWETETNEISVQTRKNPVVLASVCTTWRAIALSTPQLWTKLPLNRLWDTRGREQYGPMIEEFLSRSGTLPLSLALDHTIVVRFPQVTTVINKYTSRWSDLRLCDVEEEVASLIGQPSTDELITAPSILETLIIEHEFTYGLEDIVLSIQPQPAPSIVYSTLPLPNLGIDYGRLVRISLRNILTPPELVTLLRYAPLLKEIDSDKFHDKGRDDQDSVPAHPIVHKALTSLKCSPQPPLFERLVLPALEALAITDRYTEQALKRYCTALFPGLRTLRLTCSKRGLPEVTYDLIRVLDDASGLEELVLDMHFPFVQKPFFEHLGRTVKVKGSSFAPDDRRGNICTFLPNLKALTFKGFQIGDMDWNTFVKIFPPAPGDQDPNAIYRPFESFTMSVVLYTVDSVDSELEYSKKHDENIGYLDLEDISSFQKIIDGGFGLQITFYDPDRDSDVDFIEASRSFRNMHTPLINSSQC